MRTYSMGAIYAVPNATNPTPIPIASIKGCKISNKQAKKKFVGNQLVAQDVANSELSIGIDIQTADFRGSAMQMVMPGATSATGALMLANGEAIVIAATVTVANGTTFNEDGGVLDLTTGKWMTRVASAPTTGQYSVATATGVYTFAAADVGHTASVVYSYSSATNGQTLTFNNAIQSQSVAYKLRVYNPYLVNGVVRLIGRDYASVHFEELDEDFKVEDFATVSLKGFASQDMIGGTLQVWKAYQSELG